MAKLYFRYGTVGSAKTLNLLAVRHNYERQGKKVLLCKPAMEDRFGKTVVASRAGLSHDADVLLEADTVLGLDHAEALEDTSCILVDEAQFLSALSVDMLREVTTVHDIPVICYGLRTDFKTHLFPGSKRLLEVADSIEEVKTTCMYCERKACFNLRLGDNDRGTLDGPVVVLGGDELYTATCYSCYSDKTAFVM